MCAVPRIPFSTFAAAAAQGRCGRARWRLGQLWSPAFTENHCRIVVVVEGWWRRGYAGSNCAGSDRNSDWRSDATVSEVRVRLKGTATVRFKRHGQVASLGPLVPLAGCPGPARSQTCWEDRAPGRRALNLPARLSLVRPPRPPAHWQLGTHYRRDTQAQ